ncbi:hypothetical protein ACQR1I_08590 [Bradyrhizobium sp. HKCCYLS2038]
MSYVAQELTTAAASPLPSVIGRLSALIRTLLSRIDLSHFPKSCCN